jgi:putative tricarboxylic transport membrane protein
MRRRRFIALGAGLAAAVTAGCGTARPAMTRLTIVAATSAGQEWHAVAKALAGALREAGLVRTVHVTRRHGPPAGVVTAVLGPPRPNAPRTAGPRAATTPGDLADHRWLVAGLPMLAAAEMADAGDALDSAAPLARLIGDREVLVVSAASRLRGFDQFADSIKEDPGALLVAGGPAGGAEHLLFGLIAQGLGVDARRIEYAGYPGGAGAASAVLGGRAAAAIGRVREWRGRLAAGQARALAVSSADRIDGIDAPSLLESGVGVDYADWCGLLGPHGMTEEERAGAAELCDRLDGSPYWRETCRANGWPVIHLSGEGFSRWFAAEAARIRAVLRDLGLLSRPDTTCRGGCVNRH